MATLNKIMLIGNLTRDPEMAYTPDGKAITKFGLAVNNEWKGKDGSKHKEVTFFDCAAFDKSAETLAQYVKKGDPLFVEGRMTSKTVENEKGKRTFWNVNVQTFQFLASKKAESTKDSNPEPYDPFQS